MSENQETTSVPEQPLGQAILPALLVWLKTVLYFIVLPYKIWKSTTLRLSALAGKTIIEDSEEYPMYTFTKISYDASIFILGLLAVLISIIGLFTAGIMGAFAGIGAYFVIPFISLLKEIITMSLGVIKRLEAIDKNTRK